MTPKVPLRRATGQLAPVSSLNELLVFPTPEQTAEPRSLWLSFLGDMSLLLPAFGALLGIAASDIVLSVGRPVMVVPPAPGVAGTVVADGVASVGPAAATVTAIDFEVPHVCVTATV